jgi:hypothetical protein
MVAFEERSEAHTSSENANDGEFGLLGSSKGSQALRKALLIAATCVILYGSYAMLFERVESLILAGTAGAATLPGSRVAHSKSTKVPQYFQTTPELWAGPTATGKAPFLAQTNPVSFEPTVTFVPNTPLETAESIVGQGQNETIFHLTGHLSPYFPNPSGFGVAEYPLPPGAKISQVQVSQGM